MLHEITDGHERLFQRFRIGSNGSGYPFKKNCHLFEQLGLYDRRKLSLVWTACSMHSKQYYCQPHYCSKSPLPEPFAMNLSKTVSLNHSSKRCLPSSHEFSQYIFCWIAFFAFTTLDYHYRLSSGAPNDNFQKNICSEDNLRSRIFRTFVVKFLACLFLLGFSNI